MPNDTNELITDVRDELGRLSALAPADLERKNEEAKLLIERYTRITDEIERRRIQLNDFSLKYLGILLPGIGLLVGYKNAVGQTGFVTIGGVMVVQAAFSVVLILAYELQSKFRYPFLSVGEFGNQWKWFYYGNSQLLGMSTRFWWRARDPRTTTLPYLEGLLRFTKGFREETLPEEIKANVIQALLLQAHNCYKNRFYLQLNQIRRWSFVVSLTWLVFCGIICVLGMN